MSRDSNGVTWWTEWQNWAFFINVFFLCIDVGRTRYIPLLLITFWFTIVATCLSFLYLEVSMLHCNEKEMCLWVYLMCTMVSRLRLFNQIYYTDWLSQIQSYCFISITASVLCNVFQLLYSGSITQIMSQKCTTCTPKVIMLMSVLGFVFIICINTTYSFYQNIFSIVPIIFRGFKAFVN